MSANAVAQSLSLPYETVRRHVATIVADGRLERVSGGLVAAADSGAAPAIAAAMTEVRVALDDLKLTLRALDFDLVQISHLAGVTDAVCAFERPSDATVARIVLAGQIRSLGERHADVWRSDNRLCLHWNHRRECPRPAE